jgi:5-methylcytosine-specific restriction endonuclease McrA
MPNSLVRPRTHAFTRQSGRCFYCSAQMWTDNPLEFANQHGITLGQARRFQCTGEHLVARQDGGSSRQSNIVAACRFCNELRHKRKTPLPPERYMQLVRKRMELGRWHGLWAFQKGLVRTG